LFPLERFAARKAESRTVSQAMNIVAARSIGLKAFLDVKITTADDFVAVKRSSGNGPY
jgi:hypothetical protein